MKIQNKLFTFSAFIIISSFAVIAVIMSLNINFSVYRERKVLLRHLIDNAVSSVSYYYQQYQSGKLTEEKAKKQAIEHIRFIRYNGNNYFWINGTSKKMVMHPLFPELEGKDASQLRDPNGKIVMTVNGMTIVNEAVKICLIQKQGYISYPWPRANNLELYLPKLSYVKLFSKWNWIIGTGVYIDDIKNIVSNYILKLSLIFSIIIIIALSFSYLLSRHFSRPIMAIIQEAVEIANQKFDNTLPEIRRKDEIGLLHSTILKMRQNIIQMINDLSEINQSLNTTNEKMQEAQEELHQKNESLEKTVILAEKANLEKSRIVAIVSHELRTPLTGISGFSEMLLLDETLSEKQIAYVKRIKSSAEKLVIILNDLLELSVIESGKISINNSSFNIVNTVQEIYENAKNQFDEKQLYFQFHPDNIVNVYSDPIRIHQIITNLIGNALKYTSIGGITLSIEKKENMLFFSVADTGMGIEDKDKEEVFEMFRQAKQLSNNQKGSGLGLAICKKILDIMGGEIQIKDNPGGGSIFTFTIPVINAI